MSMSILMSQNVAQVLQRLSFGAMIECKSDNQQSIKKRQTDHRSGLLYCFLDA